MLPVNIPITMQIKAIVDSPCQHTLDEIKDLRTSLGTEFEGDDADLAEDITSVVRTEVIEALPEVTTSGLVLFHMMMQQSIARPFVLIKNDLALATERVAPIKKGEDLLQQFEKWYTSVLEVRYIARTLCPRNIRVLTIPDAAPAAAAGQALASQYPQLLYGTITAHGPHRRAAPHPPISASQPCTFFVSACGG